MFHRHFSLSFSSYSQISKIFQRRQFYWGKKSRKYKKNNRNSVKKPDIIKQFVGNYCLMENGSFNQFLDFTLRRVFSARWSTLLDRHCYLTHTVFGGLGVSGFGFVWFIYLFLIALAVCLTSGCRSERSLCHWACLWFPECIQENLYCCSTASKLFIFWHPFK